MMPHWQGRGTLQIMNINVLPRLPASTVRVRANGEVGACEVPVQRSEGRYSIFGFVRMEFPTSPCWLAPINRAPHNAVLSCGYDKFDPIR